jgi:hypothetical protein
MVDVSQRIVANQAALILNKMVFVKDRTEAFAKVVENYQQLNSNNKLKTELDMASINRTEDSRYDYVSGQQTKSSTYYLSPQTATTYQNNSQTGKGRHDYIN